VAYKQNWNPDDKPSEKEMIAYLMKRMPDIVDTAFLVTGKSDDGGRHIVAMAERDENDNSPWKEGWNDPPLSERGWRVIAMNVPTGYLEVFYNEDGSRRVTKDSSNEGW